MPYQKVTFIIALLALLGTIGMSIAYFNGRAQLNVLERKETATMATIKDLSSKNTALSNSVTKLSSQVSGLNAQITANTSAAVNEKVYTPSVAQTCGTLVPITIPSPEATQAQATYNACVQRYDQIYGQSN